MTTPVYGTTFFLTNDSQVMRITMFDDKMTNPGAAATKEIVAELVMSANNAQLLAQAIHNLAATASIGNISTETRQ